MTRWDAVCLDCGHEWQTPDDAVRFCPECESVDVTAMEVVAPEAEQLAVAKAEVAAGLAKIREIAGGRAMFDFVRDATNEAAWQNILADLKEHKP